jgi:hypothetical protein
MCTHMRPTARRHLYLYETFSVSAYVLYTVYIQYIYMDDWFIIYTVYIDWLLGI